jgi:hypothetical protein
VDPNEARMKKSRTQLIIISFLALGLLAIVIFYRANTSGEDELADEEQATMNAEQPGSTSISKNPLTPTPKTSQHQPANLALKGVHDVQQVARLVGEGAINDTQGKWGISGTDLGSMFDKDGKLYLVFGDTFGCCIPGTGGPGDAKDWRNSAMAVTTDRNPQDGLTFDDMLTDEPGHAKQLLPKNPGDVTVIPTNGIAIDNRMILHYMAVKSWGDPGMWTLNESGLATSEDDGQTWVKDTPVKWPGDSNFGQVAFVKDGEYLYLFGIPGGRFGGAKLARVPQDQALDPSSYEYFAGLDGETPNWAAEEQAGAVIVEAPVGELSVMWNGYLQRWIMTYLDDQMNRLVIREAQELWGPWGPALLLVSSQDYPGQYGAYLHPWYVENEGETIYFTMSQWGPYAVFLMKARLERGE